MKYLRAQNVLPEEVVEVIQKFVDGEFIYIPRKNDNHRAWGEVSGTMDSLKIRNNQILQNYIKGSKISELSKTFFLTEQSIRRIISKERAKERIK